MPRPAPPASAFPEAEPPTEAAGLGLRFRWGQVGCRAFALGLGGGDGDGDYAGGFWNGAVCLMVAGRPAVPQAKPSIKAVGLGMRF